MYTSILIHHVTEQIGTRITSWIVDCLYTHREFFDKPSIFSPDPRHVRAGDPGEPAIRPMARVAWNIRTDLTRWN